MTVSTLDVREYRELGYAHLERLPDGSLSVLWRPRRESSGRRFVVTGDDPWQDFERQANIMGHRWSPDSTLLAQLQQKTI